MARIKHPRFQPGRTRGLASIEFIDGYAEVNLSGNDILAQALVQHGYGIEEATPAVRPAKRSKGTRKATPAKSGNAAKAPKSAPATLASGGIVSGDHLRVWSEPTGDVHSDGRGGDIRMPGVDLTKRNATLKSVTKKD